MSPRRVTDSNAAPSQLQLSVGISGWARGHAVLENYPSPQSLLGWAMRSMTMHADVDNHASLGLVGLDRQVLPTSDTASPHAFPAFVFVRSLPRSPAERAFLVPNTTAR